MLAKATLGYLRLLAVDIGNTNINFGIFHGKQILKIFVIPTKDYHLKKLKHRLAKFKIDDCIICSVVPKATKFIVKDLRRVVQKHTYILGKNIIAPIKNRYRYPQQVGQDRLVNAFAGIMLYGAPLIIVDFGTAITFDVISKKREYVGGMILPGLEISLDALFKETALLPRVNLETPKEFIARDTKNSILSGILYGFSLLTDNLAKKIKENIGLHAKVIGTGGDIDFINGYCQQFDKIDKNLTLKGLNLIYSLKKRALKKSKNKQSSLDYSD